MITNLRFQLSLKDFKIIADCSNSNYILLAHAYYLSPCRHYQSRTGSRSDHTALAHGSVYSANSIVASMSDLIAISISYFLHCGWVGKTNQNRKWEPADSPYSFRCAAGAKNTHFMLRNYRFLCRKITVIWLESQNVRRGRDNISNNSAPSAPIILKSF